MPEDHAINKIELKSKIVYPKLGKLNNILKDGYTKLRNTNSINKLPVEDITMSEGYIGEDGNVYSTPQELFRANNAYWERQKKAKDVIAEE